MPARDLIALSHLKPKTTLVCLLSFEGPDEYSLAGGLGARVTELGRALARAGYETHLYFVGDPERAGEERREGGRFILHRWCQWISAHYPGGVYDGEIAKREDWNQSLPEAIASGLVVPAVAQGKQVLVLAEEWHTAESLRRLSDLLYMRGVRQRTTLLWNANNTFGAEMVDWGALSYAATITTVSRYMKQRMWEYGVNPMVIPNGIPREALLPPDPQLVSELRLALAPADLALLKVARFDPDKRWLQAVAAAGELRRRGRQLRFVIRGGREPHGAEVLMEARRWGLRVLDLPSPRSEQELPQALARGRQDDVINFHGYLKPRLLKPLYAACDAVLANSGHEPFGLVGLEVMAAGGVAVVGATGEDYAFPFRNSLVVETDDPLELVSGLSLLRDRPQLKALLRKHGRATARDYAWDKVAGQLLLAAEQAAARQRVDLTALR